MSDGANPRTDIGVSLVVIVLCSAVLWQAAAMPPGTFEPLGSAPVPQATAGLIILLCLWVMGRAALGLRRGDVVANPEAPVPRSMDAAVVFALTVVYVLIMAFRLMGFALVTSLFLFVAIGFLVRFERRLLPWAAGIGLAMGYGCLYLFTRVFVVDLPAG
jgi:hypothetical protein